MRVHARTHRFSSSTYRPAHVHITQLVYISLLLYISHHENTQKSAKIKGFRKGKAPLNIVSKMYGPEIRQDVIYDSVISLFYSQVQEKGLKPVGRPNLLPQNIEEGKDIKFRATFETYPEVKIANLKRLS